MINDQNQMKKAGLLNNLSNTFQGNVQHNQTVHWLDQSLVNIPSKNKNRLQSISDFNCDQLKKDVKPILNESQANNQSVIDNLNIDTESNVLNKTKNIEEQYNQVHRDIIIPENNPNKNDNRVYIAKERQNDKGLFGDVDGFNVQRFLKRVAEEKLYGVFIQTLKNNDMQGQAINIQRKMQYSLYSPQKSESSNEGNDRNLYFSSTNASPQYTKDQLNNTETNFSSSKFDGTLVRRLFQVKLKNEYKLQQIRHSMINCSFIEIQQLFIQIYLLKKDKIKTSRKSSSTNQRQIGDNLQKSNDFYYYNEQNTSPEKKNLNLTSKQRYSKNIFDLTNRNINSITGTPATETPKNQKIGDIGSFKLQGIQNSQVRESNNSYRESNNSYRESYNSYRQSCSLQRQQSKYDQEYDNNMNRESILQQREINASREYNNSQRENYDSQKQTNRNNFLNQQSNISGQEQKNQYKNQIILNINKTQLYRKPKNQQLQSNKPNKEQYKLHEEQNKSFKEQNKFNREQNKLFKEQNAQQKESSNQFKDQYNINQEQNQFFKVQNNSFRESVSMDKSNLETPKYQNIGDSFFVSAPLTSQLRQRVKQYEIYENEGNLSVNASSSFSQSPTQNFQFLQKNSENQDRIKKPYFISDSKQKNIYASLDCDIENQSQIEQQQSHLKHNLAKSLATSPVTRKNDDTSYALLSSRENSIKKQKHPLMEQSQLSNALNVKQSKQFSTLKKKKDLSQSIINEFQWREKSISNQFKIIQDQGTLNEPTHYINHPIRVNQKDLGLHQIFRKIANALEQQQILNIRTTRGNFRSYLTKRYHEGLVEKLITFLEIPSKVDYISYVKMIEKILNLTPKQKLVLCFILLDENEDGYICNSDMFSFLRKNQNKLTEMDIKNISRFAQNDLNNLTSYIREDNELEKVLIKKNNLTLTEYKLFKKKGIECLIPTQVKKDTLYHVSFQIIEHSNKYRQTVSQLEETKNSQLQDQKKNKKRACKYQRDQFFCINFDQFELHLSSLPHIPFLFFDILAYISLIQFSYINYVTYDRNYYATFLNYKSEQNEFKQDYARLLKQHEDNMFKLEIKQRQQRYQPQIFMDKVNIPEKNPLNKSMINKTTPMHIGDKSMDIKQN